MEYHDPNMQNRLVITSFHTKHPNTIHGGCEFDLELQGLRTAAPSYVEDTGTDSEAAPQPAALPDPVSNPVLEVGAAVIFKGGPVYVSSDAQTAAANRGRSACEITRVSEEDFSVHR